MIRELRVQRENRSMMAAGDPAKAKGMAYLRIDCNDYSRHPFFIPLRCGEEAAL